MSAGLWAEKDRKTFDLIEDDVEVMWLALVTPYLSIYD